MRKTAESSNFIPAVGSTQPSPSNDIQLTATAIAQPPFLQAPVQSTSSISHKTVSSSSSFKLCDLPRYPHLLKLVETSVPNEAARDWIRNLIKQLELQYSSNKDNNSNNSDDVAPIAAAVVTVECLESRIQAAGSLISAIHAAMFSSAAADGVNEKEQQASLECDQGICLAETLSHEIMLAKARLEAGRAVVKNLIQQLQ